MRTQRKPFRSSSLVLYLSPLCVAEENVSFVLGFPGNCTEWQKKRNEGETKRPWREHHSQTEHFRRDLCFVMDTRRLAATSQYAFLFSAGLHFSRLSPELDTCVAAKPGEWTMNHAREIAVAGGLFSRSGWPWDLRIATINAPRCTRLIRLSVKRTGDGFVMVSDPSSEVLTKTFNDISREHTKPEPYLSIEF